jgi:hypothetical protein
MTEAPPGICSLPSGSASNGPDRCSYVRTTFMHCCQRSAGERAVAHVSGNHAVDEISCLVETWAVSRMCLWPRLLETSAQWPME